MGTGLKNNWTGMLARIQAPLEQELAAIRNRIDELLFSRFRPVDEMIVHLFSKSGKMIRPTLLLLSADRNRTNPDHLIASGAAIEIIHTASLVHDDSIDGSSHRRGVQTLNFKWNHKSSVIIGDYLLARALDELCRLGNIGTIREISAACGYLATGEMRQMIMEGNLEATEKDYFQFIREKTGSLFSATCAAASLLGGSDGIEGLKKFGMLFGSIFQLTDDLLDYVGSAPETGKPKGIDLRERKMTLPLIHAVSRMDEEARAEVRETFSRQEIGGDQVERLTELVISFGGIDYTRSRVTGLAREAKHLADTLPGELAPKLRELVEITVERDR